MASVEVRIECPKCKKGLKTRLSVLGAECMACGVLMVCKQTGKRMARAL